MKNLINPIAQGGAPIYANDLLATQENAKIATGQNYENLSRNCDFIFDRFGTAILSSGFFITLPVYNLQSDDGFANSIWDISSFYCWLDGEVCFYPGGTLTFRTMIAAQRDAWFVVKGAPTNESRVFKDGINKPMIYTPTVELFQANETPLQIGWENVPPQYVGRQAVQINPMYAISRGEPILSKFYHLNHPGGTWDALNIRGVINALNV